MRSASRVQIVADRDEHVRDGELPLFMGLHVAKYDRTHFDKKLSRRRRLRSIPDRGHVRSVGVLFLDSRFLAFWSLQSKKVQQKLAIRR